MAKFDPRDRLRQTRRDTLLMLSSVPVCRVLTSRAAAQDARQCFIAPRGRGSGTSWQDAGSIANLDKLIALLGPGGIVNLRADDGDSYDLGETSVPIAHGGTAAAPVTIRGLTPDGRKGYAVFIGNRTNWTRPADTELATDVSGWIPGRDIFTLRKGASHLRFERIDGRQAGAVINCSANLEGIRISDCRGYNVRRWFEMASTAVLRDVVIDGLAVVGFSKQCIRCRGDSHAWTIRNVDLDSARQDRDDFAVGIKITGTAHDILIDTARLANCQDTRNKYQNGDGGSTERENYGIIWRNIVSHGHCDGGLDNKGQCTYEGTIECYDNKVQLRFWTHVHSVTGRLNLHSPRVRGGTGSPVLIGAYNSVGGATVHIADGATFDLGDTDGYVIYLGGNDVTVNIGARTIRRSNAGSELIHMKSGITGAAVNWTPPLSVRDRAILSPNAGR